MVAATAVISAAASAPEVPANTLLFEYSAADDQIKVYVGNSLSSGESYGWTFTTVGIPDEEFVSVRGYGTQLFNALIENNGGFIAAGNAGNVPAGSMIATYDVPANFNFAGASITAVEMEPNWTILFREEAAAEETTPTPTPDTPAPPPSDTTPSGDETEPSEPTDSSEPSSESSEPSSPASSTPSGTTGTGTAGPGGAGTGNNPQTGVALAIIPTLIAAGAAVAVAKKRK